MNQIIENPIRKNFWMERADVDWAVKHARSEGKSLNALIREMLRDFRRRVSKRDIAVASK